MPTTPINGLRIPALSNNANVPLDLSNLAADVDSRLVGRFTSTADRDAKIPSPVDGMIANVTGVGLMLRRNGAWAPFTPPAPVTAAGTAAATRSDDIEDSWYQATIADPGYPYRIEANANVRLFVNAGTRADVRIRAGNGVADVSLPILTFTSGMSNDTTGHDLVLPTRASGVLTGVSRIIGYCKRVQGTGGWSISPAPTVYYRLVPA